MIPKQSVMRVARPTDNLQAITEMYEKGLGFKILGGFKDHDGFNGSILGHEQSTYHLEFTSHKGTSVGKAPTQDNLLVFYLPDHFEWQQCCKNMEASGFKSVSSYNPYWEKTGKTYEDIDGYRVVLQNNKWVL